MNILSLFDGMSCGQLALKELGVKKYSYFASEIDKFCIELVEQKFPDTINIGNVLDIEYRGQHLSWNNKSKYCPIKIDLLIGGSPCLNLSFAGKQKGLITKTNVEITSLSQYLYYKGLGLEFEGQSYLFWEYMRLLNEIKPKYFLLENVKMSKQWEKVFNQAIGFPCVEINSSLLSAQSRKRLYWVGELQEDGTYKKVEIEQPQDKGILLKDILEDEVDEKYNISEKQWVKLLNYESNSRISPLDGKSYCLNTMQGGHRQPKISYAHGSREFEASGWKEYKSNTLCARDYKDTKVIMQDYKIRKLTPLECQRLQTVPDDYFDGTKISNSQKYKMLGNGWTVSVIAYILSHLTL